MLKDIESFVLAETMMYIEESPATSTNTNVATSIKLSDIRKFYDYSFARVIGKELNCMAPYIIMQITKHQ